MVSQQRGLTDDEIAKLEIEEKAKKQGLTDAEILSLEQKSAGKVTTKVTKPPWYDNYLGLIRPLLAGAQSTMSGGIKGLTMAADFISDKLGIPKSDAARMIARDLDLYAEANRKRGVGGIPGKVAEGLGGAAVAIPELAILGPYGMAVHGGLQGAAEGGVPGAITGAIGGGLSQGILKGTSGLSVPGRMGAGAAFGAATTPGGVGERVAGAGTMAGLGVMGGKKQPGVVDLRPAAEKGAAQEITPTRKLIGAVRSARPVLASQEEARSAERGKRLAQSIAVGKVTSGEAGFEAEMRPLAGKMPAGKYNSIYDAFTQPERDYLFNEVKTSPFLTAWENRQARRGLKTLLNKDGMDIPQDKQLILLHRVFGGELSRTLADKVGDVGKIKLLALEGLNIERTLMASGDVSAGFRQMIFLGPRHPTLFAKALGSQFKFFFGKNAEKAYHDSAAEIASRRTFPLMRQHDLALMEMDSSLSIREEKFLGSHMLEKVPVIGKMVHASGRAYTGALNKFRADVFDSLVGNLEKMGIDPFKSANKKMVNQIAKFVNAGTGRGDLGKRFSEAAVVLNATLFSPRLIASRVKLLNPVYYWSLRNNPALRHESWKTLLSMVGFGGTMIALGKAAGGEVNMDWTNSDFGKIKFGNTRIDPWGGFQQYFRAFGQFVEGQTTNPVTGKITKTGEGYKPTTRLTLASRFLEYKAAPTISTVLDLLRGRTASGEKINVNNQLVQRIVPMAWQDLYDVYKEDPTLLPLGLAGFLGFGVQTYKERQGKY